MNAKCQFISVENIWTGDIRITIPDIQRGLVWNAAQIEVFWDSLLRGIPIGWFSVAESAGELILLDGQQRWHAINAAKPNAHGVLWCAILDDPSKLNIYNRKYLFRWTTPAHPWGFRLEANEKAADRLNLYERRKVLLSNGRSEEDLFRKPAVGGIVPFPYDGKIKIVKFQTILNEEPPENYTDSEKQYWTELQAKIKEVISQPIIPLMGKFPTLIRQEYSEKPDPVQGSNAEIDTEWTETFFLRMNSQGTPFSQNELAYSALKSSLHAIGIESPRSIFEETARILNISDTADLAQIMLQLITFSLYGKEISRHWNAGEIKEFFKDKSGDREKINAEIMSLKTAAADLQNLIGDFNARQERIQILPYHLAQMPSEIIRLALLILKSCCSGAAASEKLLSLMFLLWWFPVESRVNCVSAPISSAAELIAGEFQKNKNISLEDLFAKCVFEGFLVPPITPAMLKGCNAAYGIDADPVRNELWELRRGNTFYWDISKSFVLLACGKYLENSFLGVKALGEDNRPWDYDLFLPQAKTPDDGSTLSWLCWSSGNNVPIALTTNRSKQDDLPDKNYPDNCGESRRLLYLDMGSPEEIFPGGTIVPDKFNGFAWQRYCRMYEEVYTALGWDSFVNTFFRDGKDFAERAKNLSERIHAATGKTYSWYYAVDGRDLPVMDDTDFGRYQYYILRDSADWCYAIETQDFKKFAIYGKRKPVNSAIGKGIRWWDDSVCLENLTEEKAFAWLKGKSKEDK